MLALGITAGLGDLVRLRAVHAALVGEEQQPVVGRGDEEVLDHVVGAQLRALHALAATVLLAVVVAARPLDVAVAGDRDDHLLLGDEVFDRDVAVEAVEDLGAAVVAEAVNDRGELVADDRALARGRRQDVVVVGDARFEFLRFVDDLLTLEGRETTQLHVEDRLRLDIVDVEELLQSLVGILSRRRPADEGDDLVERVERLEVAAQDVHALFGLAEAVTRAPDDDLDLVVDPQADEAVERQGARHAVDDGEHVGAEVLLQLRVLVQVVQHDLRDRVALEHDHEALPGTTRRLVADVGDTGDLALAGEVADLHRDVVRVDLVRQLGDHEARASLDLLDVHDRAHRDRAASGAVRLLDAAGAEDLRAGGEVGPGDALHERLEQLFASGIRVLQRPQGTGGHLAQVVRRDVRRHTDGDTDRSVDQQVRETRRQDRRLLGLTVVVVLEVDGLFLDVAHHLERKRSHLRLGVPGRGRTLVSRRPEVALAEGQRIAQRPRLDETHQGVVDRSIAVRVVMPHDLADDAGALRERLVGAEAAVVHAVDHAAVDGLETVAHVGQSAPDDDTHRVVEIAPLHLELQVDLVDPTVVVHRFGGDVGGLGSDVVSHGFSVSYRVDRVRCRGSGRLWRCAG